MIWHILFPKKKKKPTPPLPGGAHDLQKIYHEVNTTYFKGELKLTISWSGSASRPVRSSRRLGSYCLRTKHIRIHRLLDHAHFPSYFIAFIVYHEMLHSLLPPIQTGSRRRAIHHAAFRKKEQEFIGYEEVKNWEKENRKLFFYGRTQ